MGLRTAIAPPLRAAFQVKATSMGYLPGLNYDKIEALIKFGEGEQHR